MDVIWPSWKKLVNESFIPYVHNKDRYNIFYGGRGSSKSNFAAKKLIYRCLTEDYFRYILIRQNYNTIKDSIYQTLKDIIIELGLEELFIFRSNPLEIICINGNKFIARGLDDATKIKSVKDPTGAWWEEDIPSEADFITITTSIRTQKAYYLQEIFTINPEVEGNYQEHWFWLRFFASNPNKQTFNDITEMEIERYGKKETVKLTYSVHHSDYTHNRWIPGEFIAFLVDLKRTNPYYWTIYCKGLWGNKQLGGLFYKKFDMSVNTKVNVYNPSLPLHISFDFNVNPYMSATVWQINGKIAYNIDEFAMEYPNNDTKSLCEEIRYKYRTHKTGMYIYGDPSGKQADTRSEKGFNDYTIIENELAQFRPDLRVARAHPPVKMRGSFINAVFDYNYAELHFIINENSVYLKNDLLFGKEASDGTKLKERVKGDNGITYEKYHHHSDTMDYFVCEAFQSEFDMYQNGDAKSFNPKVGVVKINPKHRL